MSRNEKGIVHFVNQMSEAFRMSLYVAIASLCFISSSIYSQSFTQDAVLEDLGFLKKSIQTYNPGLYRFNPYFDKKSDSLIATVFEDLDMNSYFTKVAQLCALSHEGHFSVGSWEDTIHKGFYSNTYSYLPFSVKIVGRRVFVWDNYSNDSSLQRGDEIISINGNTTLSIVERMYSCISSDGKIENNLRARLQSGFGWMYYLFEEQPEFFDMEVDKFPSQKKIKVSIDALNREEMRVNYSSRIKNEKTKVPAVEDDLYSLSFQDSIAFLTLKTFDWKVVENGAYDAKKLYEKLFEKIQENGASVLVVDLRGNTGGRNEFAMEMIPYIMKNDARGQVYKTSVSWKGKSKTYKLPKKSKGAFEGRIFTLTDAWTYSAGASLARYLNEYGGAYSVGSETGSRYKGFVAGSKQAVYLPNSDIKIGIPRYAYVFPDTEDIKLSNRGLIPDFPTNPTMKTYMDEMDLEIEKVKNLVEECATCHF